MCLASHISTKSTQISVTYIKISLIFSKKNGNLGKSLPFLRISTGLYEKLSFLRLNYSSIANQNDVKIHKNLANFSLKNSKLLQLSGEGELRLTNHAVSEVIEFSGDPSAGHAY